MNNYAPEDRPIEEEIDSIWTNMDPEVRQKARQNIEAFRREYSDLQDRIDAEKTGPTPSKDKFF